MPAQLLCEKSIHPQPIHGPGQDGVALSLSKRLEGKVAIVTGGARGIGEATARLFARHGAHVVIADIRDALGSSVASSLAPTVSFFHCDVSLEEDVRALMTYTVSKYGRIDILVNNAAVLGNQTKHKSILDFNPEEFDMLMSVNVKGVALGVKHFARTIIARGLTGCVVSIASVAGVMGGLGPHAYTASKHAVVGITKNAACELGKYGIRVNCISPFGVATSMLIEAWKEEDEDHGDDDDGIPCPEDVAKLEELVRGMANLNGAILTTRDIAEACLYLASDESKYVSGHNLVVDGGVTTSRNCIGL